MNQEQAQGGGGGGGGKKRNRNKKNKKKNQGNQQGSGNGENQSRSSSETAPPVTAPVPVQQAPVRQVPQQQQVCTNHNGFSGPEEEEAKTCQQQKSLVENLAREAASFVQYNWSQIQDAESNYYKQLAASAPPPPPKKSEDSDELDLFASDDEPAEKPKFVAPKPKAAPKQSKNAKQEQVVVPAQGPSALASEIAKARQHIKNSLECVDGLAALAGGANPELINKLNSLEIENKNLKKVSDDLRALVVKLEGRVAELEKEKSGGEKAKKEDEDEDMDLFGSGSDSEEEDAEKVRVREERLAAYHAKKAKKPALIAKTSVLLDVKPWDDETDMNAMLKACKTIQKEGLVWGASKLVPVGYGIQKLQVMCVVEDEKVSIDELCEQISGFEDLVQSVDVAAMSKI